MNWLILYTQGQRYSADDHRKDFIINHNESYLHFFVCICVYLYSQPVAKMGESSRRVLISHFRFWRIVRRQFIIKAFILHNSRRQVPCGSCKNIPVRTSLWTVLLYFFRSFGIIDVLKIEYCSGRCQGALGMFHVFIIPHDAAVFKS
jgi:hypothetical protein